MRWLARKARTAWGIAQAYTRGWRTPHRFVVIESDDWGGIRMSSREAYERMTRFGCPMHRSHYNLDSLETDEDLDRLFEVLDSVRDACGRPACLTVNMIMANPDFAAIRESGFRRYLFEPTEVTLARDPARRGVMRRWVAGSKRLLCFPQLHAREHIAWWDWLAALRADSPEAHLAFSLGLPGVYLDSSTENQCFFVPLYLDDDVLARSGVDLNAMIRDGADLFERHFGFRSESTIAPNYVWTDTAEAVWFKAGIRYLQGAVFQRVPGSNGMKRRAHFVGEHGPSGCRYLVRNCIFEPSMGGGNWVRACLRQIAIAFRFHKPAVICTHRVNYVGGVDPDNRVLGLSSLSTLLREICRLWPDVHFLNTVELGRMIESGCRDVDTTTNGKGP
jgi:hypothetical protein